MKVAVIGGGSSYTPELVNGFIERADSFPLDELWLMDILPERLEIVGGFAQRMVAAKGNPFSVHLTTNQREAARDAAYVTTQLRVGWMQARREDEYLGLRHGLIGQETTGIGGMAKALRTIPVILNIAADMRELAAPDALLVNFTNPAGLVTEALARHAADVRAVGVCNIPLNTKMDMLKLFDGDIAPECAQLNTLGLNHLTWHRGFTIDGEDVWPQVLSATIDDLRAAGDEAEWQPKLIETLRMIPNDYLQYFYETERKLAAQTTPSRAEKVMDIERGLLAQYAEPDRTEPPADLMKRGGAYYSTVATQLLNAHYNDLHEIHVVNTPHLGAVGGYPADWVMELPCEVSRRAIDPLPAEPLPPVAFGLLAQVKSYEILTVEAAVTGDRDAAYQALLAHPLGPAADKIDAALDDMLETHRRYLPQFFTDKGSS
jgi:6-phospho-beta-glucosidase